MAFSNKAFMPDLSTLFDFQDIIAVEVSNLINY
jgi:hypothetical protein